MYRNKVALACNALVIALLLALPYYLFHTSLFIGGDDSRLLYVFPHEFLQSVASSTWLKFSSAGSYTPNQFLLPLLGVWSGLALFLPLQVLGHLAFSLPLVLGFIFFQRFMGELVRYKEEHWLEIGIGALLFILSPIMIVGQLAVFLYSVWLLAALPITAFYLTRYIKRGSWQDVAAGALWSIVFSLAFFSIPWLLGAILPLAIGALAGLLLMRKNRAEATRRVAIFTGALVLSQCFWLLPFGATFLGGAQTNYGSQVLSQDTADTFTPTVNATATGTVLYPLLNLFHRQIAFDFNWPLKNTYTHYYDYLVFFNVGFLLLLAAGLWLWRRFLSGPEKLSYLLFLTALPVTLFLFTVNIGPLKELFLALGHIPGFAMFRNAFDKFAPGYVFIYACVMTFSLVMVSRYLSRKHAYLVVAGIGLLVLANAQPIKGLINKPLWTTKDTGTSIRLPQEYLDFMAGVKTLVPPSGNILSVPYGISSYTIVKDEMTDAVFAGRSPVQLLSGRNDFSGNYSWSPAESQELSHLIKNRQYQKLRNFLAVHHIQYIIDTGNIPHDVLRSYLFDNATLANQDGLFKDQVYGQLLATSKHGAYKLYKVNNNNDSSLITYPNRVLASQGDAIGDIGLNSLLNIISDDTVYASAAAALPTTQTVQLVGQNKPTPVSEGAYELYVNHPDVYSIFYNDNAGMLSYKQGIDYRVDGQLHTGEEHRLRPLKSTDLLKINNRFITPANLAEGYTVSSRDTITAYSSTEENLVPPLAEIFQSWIRGDCNSTTNQSATTFSLDQTRRDGEVMTLSAKGGHNACLRNTAPLGKNKTYGLSFEYRTTADDLKINILDKDISVLQQAASPRSAAEGQERPWRQFTYVFESKNAASASLYLYSGLSSALATTEYKNLGLFEYTANKNVPLAQNTNTVNLRPVITAKSQLELLPGEKTIPDDGFSGWNRADCAAADNRPSTEFTLRENSRQITLAGENGHEACIYQDFLVNHNDVYRIEFEYQTTPGADVAMQAYQGREEAKELAKVRLKTDDSGWRHFSHEVSDLSYDNLRLYLYSGSSKKGHAITTYKNLRISHYPKTYYHNFLVSQAGSSAPSRPKRTTYRQDSNHATRVALRGVSAPFLLSFAESFDPGWKIYLRPIADTPSCNQAASYTRASSGQADSGKIVECQPGNSLMPASELAYLGQRPLFESSHTILNGYANGWTFDPGYIKAHYDPRFYRQNPDGSLDVDFTIYFSPQSYFHAGLAITAVTVCGCLVLLSRRERRVHYVRFGERRLLK